MTPIEMPDTPSGIARVRFDIERVDFGAHEASGRQGGVQAGWPLWTASFELERSDPDSADLWRAFFDRLRGRQRRFYAGEPARRFPKLLPQGFAGLLRAGGGAFDGSATAWSTYADPVSGNVFVYLEGMPPSIVLSTGDYMGLKWDAAGSPPGTHDRRTMVRLVLNSSTDPDGTSTLVVEPPIDPLVVPPTAVAHFDDPKCVMQLVPEKSGLGPIGAGGALSNGTIAAIQDLRA